jgi:hypothetical protein
MAEYCVGEPAQLRHALPSGIRLGRLGGVRFCTYWRPSRMSVHAFMRGKIQEPQLFATLINTSLL